MQLIEEFRAEHERIERVLGALRTWASRLVAGDAAPEDRAHFAAFFRTFAGAFHHEREEHVLVPALTQGASLPEDRGPVAVLLDDHAKMASLQERLWSETDPVRTRQLATEFSHVLWQHIDMENHVLFPEAEAQLRRAGTRDLAGRGATPAEEAAAVLGARLAEVYPPGPPDAIRGDGCVMCHAYGDRCRGIEREWWNEWEWEELESRVAAT